MKTKDEKLTEVVILTIIGQISLPIGLTLMITHAYFGRPEHLIRPLVGTATGTLLLAAAASRLNDARFLTKELVRGLAIATAVVALTSIRIYFKREPHRLAPREIIAAVACAAGYLAAAFWLRRERKA